MLIRDLNAQVEKALNEVEMRYSKGMIFTIYDLLATSSCKDANNFSSYKNRLQPALSSRRIAHFHSTSNGVNKYIKL